MGNPLISFRLAPEMVAAIAQRYPGLSPSEGCKALLLETLGMVASPENNTGLEDIYLRIAALEARVFTPVDTSVDTPDDTPNDDDPVSTPVDTLQTPELTSHTPDDTLPTPVDTPDIKGIIQGTLDSDPTISKRGMVELLKRLNIKIPSPRGLSLPTGENIIPFLPYYPPHWKKGKSSA